MTHSPDTRTAKTVAELVDQFGGTAKFAEWADVVPSAVSNWKSQNHIPNGYHLRLYLEAQKRRIQIASEVFGLMPEPN